jgi:hypothetical protein
MHIEVAGRRLGQTETRACHLLGMQQTTLRCVGYGSMRKQDLTRRKATWIAIVRRLPHAEESELEADRCVFIALQPAGDVPPLDAVARMRAVVTRQDEGRAAQHRLEFGAMRLRRHRGKQRELEQQTSE